MASNNSPSGGSQQGRRGGSSSSHGSLDIPAPDLDHLHPVSSPTDDSTSNSVVDASSLSPSLSQKMASTILEPTRLEPTTLESTASESTAFEPTASEPSTSEPTASEPTASEPTASEPTASEDLPYEPGKEEADYYYYGLPSFPRLVARSSGLPWCIDPVYPRFWPLKKVFKNVGKHPIVDHWNAPLQKQIVDALGVAKFTSIDILRIGYGGEHANSPLPVVLWIGVPPGSLSWSDGMDIVNNCITILASYGLSDVQCEIRESQFFRAGCYLAPFPMAHEYSKLQLPLTASPGQPISAMGSSIEGSLGLYLKPGDSNPHGQSLWAVTCRHVAHPPESTQKSYQDKPNSDQRRMKILLPSNSSLHKITERAKEYLLCVSSARERAEKRLRECKPEEEEEQQKELDELSILCKDAQKFVETILPQWQSEANRVLGCVRFAPPIQTADPIEASDMLGPLRDWALIEVDKDKFSGPVRNEVDITEGLCDQGRYILNRGIQLRQEDGDWEFPSNGKLPLSQTVPISELRSPTMLDANRDPCLFVGKRGNESGMTWGVGNELKSIVWKEDNKKSMEFCVVAVHKGGMLGDKRLPFSEERDSGAAVFDVKGRVVGILVGGVKSPSQGTGMDVTYVTPMAWLQQDMKKHGFSVEIA